MKFDALFFLAVLCLLAFLLRPTISKFLFDSGGDYNVVWPRAYNNWVNMKGYIDVPSGRACKK